MGASSGRVDTVSSRTGMLEEKSRRKIGALIDVDARYVTRPRAVEGVKFRGRRLRPRESTLGTAIADGQGLKAISVGLQSVNWV